MNLRMPDFRLPVLLVAVFSGLFFQPAYAQQAPIPAAISETDFARPASRYGIRCWWWWLDGNVTKTSITRDLEAMKEKGFSGACIFDAGGHDQRGNGPVPEGPTFASPAWLDLFQFAVVEAYQLGLVLSAGIRTGRRLGGPDVSRQVA